ncbi:unnamed protein product [Mytilus coruscus]|uniref:B box-type domain-containing protein n=1 Tax=Mytilus coruscus TaxID=42192 RepID=A0A6J8A550_MYTCO|nr:unnamed protein product [Mytilus coruscus]
MTSVIHCGPCLYDETHQNARKWCTSCEEGLCEDCEKNHRKTKTTRDHKLISIEDYRKIEDVPITFICSDHCKKLEWFCTSHDKALCVVCLPSEHRSCSDVIPIDVAAANARQSTAVSYLQEAIEVTLRNITHCIKNRNTAREDIEKQEKNIRRIIQNSRTKINSHLDKLEEKLMQTLVSATKTCKLKCNNFLQQFNLQEEKLITMKDQVVQMKKFASDLQVFLGTRQIYKLVMNEIESIKTLTDSIYDYTFNLKLSNAVFKEFGDIQVTEHTSNLDIKELKLEQAQMQHKIQPPSCAILPNGNLLFANYYDRNILEYSVKGNFIGSIRVSAEPYDITVLDLNRIAITYGDKEFFEIFNYRNKRVKKKIKTRGHCWGLSQSNGKIYVNLDNVEVFDITGNKLRSLAAANNYISASKNNIFCSNNLYGTVCCYDMNGQEVWKIEDDSLKYPLGVSNDRSGNAFVVGGESKNLILIEHDGKAYKNLLNLEEKSSPRVVCYDKDKNILLYCDEDGDYCALYKVLSK